MNVKELLEIVILIIKNSFKNNIKFFKSNEDLIDYRDRINV